MARLMGEEWLGKLRFGQDGCGEVWLMGKERSCEVW